WAVVAAVARARCARNAPCSRPASTTRTRARSCDRLERERLTPSSDPTRCPRAELPGDHVMRDSAVVHTPCAAHQRVPFVHGANRPLPLPESVVARHLAGPPRERVGRPAKIGGVSSVGEARDERLAFRLGGPAALRVE